MKTIQQEHNQNVMTWLEVLSYYRKIKAGKNKQKISASADRRTAVYKYSSKITE